MAHKKTSSAPVASKAGRVLANPRSSKTAKSLAGSVVSQSPGKHGGKTKK